MFVEQPLASRGSAKNYSNTERGGGGKKDRVAALNQSFFKTVVEEEEEQLESITVGDEEKHLEAEKEREARER